MSFILESPDEFAKALASKARALRLAINLSQEGLAQRAGISVSSLKRFEHKGLISLSGLLKLALVFGRLEDFKNIFKAEEFASIDEIIDPDPERQRGRRK